MPQEVLKTNLPLDNPRTGKVRDLYDTTGPDGAPRIVLVATDRISAFDVIMANGVSGRGVVLTQISRFWFDHFADRVTNHVVSTDPADLPGLDAEQCAMLEGRLTIGRKTKVVPIECVVRGYLAGSGWKEYQESGTVCGVALPEKLKEGSQLPEPIFTPATKAASGHDENISVARMEELVGGETTALLQEKSLALYQQAAEYAREQGIIIADTKFEFGWREGELILIDEVLTPDSSRFWDAAQYAPGGSPASFDKQFVRDYLESLDWNKEPPAPELPPDIVTQTQAKYRDAYRRLAGQELPM